MKIMVQKDEVDPSRNVDGNPYIIKKQTETNLIVQDGETIVISGLTKQTKADRHKRSPLVKGYSRFGMAVQGREHERYHGGSADLHYSQRS